MIRVVLVEGRKAVREGLKRLLAAAAEIQVVGEVTTSGEGADLLGRMDADLSILGSGSTGPELFDAMNDLLRVAASPPLLVVASGVDRAVREATLRGGAAGYVDLGSVREDLVRAVRLVCRGNVFTSAPSGEGRRGPAGGLSGKASRGGSSGRDRPASKAWGDGGRRLR